MLYTIELHSTISKNINISIDSKKTLKELHELIFFILEDKLLDYNQVIMDIFAFDIIKHSTMSIPRNRQTVGNFIRNHPNYFTRGINRYNIFKIYVIDNMYPKRLKKK
jgi:hypothetical protein